MDKVFYFDNAATTFPKPERVTAAVRDTMENGCVNAGRGSYTMAMEAAGRIIALRERILAYAGSLKGGNVVLAPSATIAFNMLLGGIRLGRGDVVYVSPFEHNAVMRVLYAKSIREGFEIRELPLDKNTLSIDLDKTMYEFSRHIPDMVCMSHVSNVTGYILPIRQICSYAKESNEDAITIVDGCQALGLMPKPLADNGTVDFYVFAGHKTLYGPFGIGGFICHSPYSTDIIKNRDAYQPYIFGGTGTDSLNMGMLQDAPEMLEAGSIDIAAVNGLLAAMEDNNDYFHEEKMKTQKLAGGLEETSGVYMYLPTNMNEHINIVSFNVEGYSSSEAGMILNDEYNIAVRTGYHCAPLIHNYLGDKAFLGTVRASIGRHTTEEEIRYFINAVREIAQG